MRKAVKTEEILIDIVTASEEGFDSKPKEFLDKWAAALQALELTGKIVGILHTKNDSLADIVKDEGTEYFLVRIISRGITWTEVQNHTIFFLPD